MTDKDVEIIQVIRTNLTVRGDGTKANPSRRIVEYWTMDGQKLAEYDINEELGCNVRGHRVKVGATKCDYCAASLSEMAEDAGEALLAERIRGMNK